MKREHITELYFKGTKYKQKINKYQKKINKYQKKLNKIKRELNSLYGNDVTVTFDNELK